MDAVADRTTNPLFAGDPLASFAAVEPDHVRPAVRQVLDAERRELDRLAGVQTPSIEWLCETERVLERVHDVWNPVSHLNGVASTPALREAYNDCLTSVTEFFSDLGLNEALYSQFERLGRTVESEPEAELIRQSLRDFRLAGVALTGEAKEAYRQVNLELAKKQAEFEQHLMDATDAFSLHETDPGNLSGLPAEVLERARSAAVEQDLEGWLLKLDPPTYQSVMTHADSPQLRETYYRA